MIYLCFNFSTILLGNWIVLFERVVLGDVIFEVIALNEMDLDYVEALEYGLPPTGGMEMGIDRIDLWCY